VLTGGFQRHGNVLRPVAAILLLVALLAVGLVASSVATRNMALLPLMWVQALLPGLVAAWVLFMPASVERVLARRTRRDTQIAPATPEAGN
jgi:lipopolysaccharide export system permease protein